MSRCLNDVTMLGNLTRDPELRQTPDGTSVCRFSLALNRSYKDRNTDEWISKVTYVDVVAWRDLGERVDQYCTKGRQVLVKGRLESSSWEQDGQKRTKLEVVANEVIFVGNRSSNETSGTTNLENEPVSAKSTNQSASADIDLEEIPF